MIPSIPESRLAELADIIDGYDSEIATLNDGKSDTLKELREELRAAGLDSKQVSVEVKGFRASVKRRAALRKDPSAVEEADETADRYFAAISRPRVCAHEEAA